MADKEPLAKRRKVSEQGTSSPLKLLREAERSKITMEGLQSLSHDKEFWIIRVPRDVDIMSLTGNRICLDSTQQTVSCGQKAYDVMVSPEILTAPSYKIVTPTSKPGRLNCGFGISGEVLLQQTVDIPAVEIPAQAISDNLTVPVGLKQRWKPFGWKLPYISQVRSTCVPRKPSARHKKTKKDKRKKVKK